MNRYLLSVRHFFSGEETFEIEAESKEAALAAGRKLVNESPEYTHGGNYARDSVKVVKKLKPAKKVPEGK